MKDFYEEEFSAVDLEIQKLVIDDRIKVIELDLNSPLEANTNFMRKLLALEQTNLRKINVEIWKRKHPSD